MKLKIKAGKQNQKLRVYIQDSTGAGKTGVLHSDLICKYVRDNNLSVQTLTLNNTATFPNHVDNSWVEVSSSDMPGLYELCVPDLVLEDAGEVLFMLRANGSTATGMIPVLMELELDEIDYRSTSYANLEASAGTIVTGTVSTTSSGTTSLVASALPSSVDDHYNGRVLIFTSGTLSAQATNITDYVGSTKTLTFTALSSAPQSGNTFIIV